MSPNHDDALSHAFDGQSERFERAPVQTDPAALGRLVQFADLPDGSRILDAGCGPGLVARAFLEAGHRVTGVDLSAQMIDRAQARCEGFGDRARFLRGSIYDAPLDTGFDAAVSRYVLHHVEDPARFLQRQVDLLRPGGAIVLSDHVTDPDPDRAGWHNAIERLRDTTHTSNLSTGALVDLFASHGLESIRLVEEPFTLDFDEWFDRGTPSLAKPEVRARLLDGGSARGYTPRQRPDGGITIHCIRAIVAGRKP